MEEGGALREKVEVRVGASRYIFELRFSKPFLDFEEKEDAMRVECAKDVHTGTVEELTLSGCVGRPLAYRNIMTFSRFHALLKW